jgi:hypothetical protein
VDSSKVDRKRVQGVLGPDGIVRSPEREIELNSLFASVFSRGDGREVLRYLRSISIEAVGGPGVKPDELMHREGMRYLVGIVEQRIGRGRNG